METEKNDMLFNALASAWVRGWYAGIDGQLTDEQKRQDSMEIGNKFPVLAASPDLLAACKDFVFLERTNMTKKQVQLYIDQAKTAIEKAEGTL